MAHSPRPAFDLHAMVGGLPRPFWVLWAGMLVNRCGSFVLPFMAIYLTESRGLTPSQAGLVVALYGAGATVSGPLGGFLADHVGRRVTMMIALVAGGAGMIALGFAQRLEVIVPAFFFLAMIGEMYRPAMQAAVADLVAPAERSRAFGWIYWAINLGFAIGVAAGGLLAGVSFRWLFVGDGITTLLFGILIGCGVPETRPHPMATHGRTLTSARSGFWAPYRDGPFLRFLGLAWLYAILFTQNGSTFPLDMAAHGLPKSTFGVILAINGILIVLVQPLVGPWLAHRAPSRMLAAGAALTGIGFGLNAIATSAPVYALGVVVWTLGEIAVLPISHGVVADLAPRHLRGRYQGAYGLSFGLAVCVSPVLGTFVLQRFGSAALWTGCLAVGLAIAVGQLALAPALARARATRVEPGLEESRDAVSTEREPAMREL